MKKSDADRRALLLGGIASGAALVATTRVADALAQEACGIRTPRQPEGPFYPVTRRADLDADLVVLEGAPAPARGEIILLTVRVVDEECRPVEGATVDLWQACASGKYDHPSDPNDAALDPNFQYHAILTTKAEGEVRVRTIKPGAYPNDPTWIRPPHIHFKITAPGFRALTTQMYFEGEALNAVDLILRQSTPAERSALTVAFTRPVGAGVDATPEGTFEVVLRKG